MKRKYNFYKKVAFAMAIVMLAEIVCPTAALALTSGPGNPEFSSFEPVATTSMVNEFNGGFTYNIPVLEIPGANGGGYACALSYHSGETVESEASWVGYGWSLNPGAINRSKRGIADDANGSQVIYKNDVPTNWTASVGVQAGDIEAFSVGIPISVNASLRYNNYKGFGYTAGAGLSIQKGLVSLGYSVSDGSGSFSFSVNPASALNLQNKKGKLNDARSQYKAAKTGKEKIDALKKVKKAENIQKLNSLSTVGSAYGMHAFSDDLRPTNLTPYVGASFNMSVSAVLDPAVFPVGMELGFNANLTTQTNIPSRNLATYGYLYSLEGATDDDGIMDYYVEKEATYNKRDRYMSIPFSNADVYSVTGEGVGGGFRLYNKDVGNFFPNTVESYTPIVQMGTSAHIGLDLGMGFNLGVGFQRLQVKKDWDENGNTNNYQFATRANEGSFFRFNNDKGGALTYVASTAPMAAGLDQVIDVPGIKTARATVPNTDIYTSLSDTVDSGLKRSGRSSYIAYHTNNEMAAEANSKKYRAYQKDSLTETLLDRSNITDGIGELVVNNEDGNRYVYGLPVYSRNETSMQYDLRGSSVSVQNNFVAYKTSTNHRIEVGEINNDPYATSYLLTEITSPDYLDRSLNGPTDDDFGGYTKFIYNQTYGSTDKKATSSNWYHWRIPYTGLAYNPNDLTDNGDDVGSFSSGDKEIYYLKQIETKTHIAVFVTNRTDFTLGGTGGVPIAGSGAKRQDGLQSAADNSAIGSSTAKGSAANQKLEMLERIELYAKPVDGSKNYKLLKTTHFEYDYSTCGYVPNNIGSSIDINGTTPAELDNINVNKGKLTLRKVWFEYEGVVNARISPYIFEYTYPDDLGDNGLPSVYNSIKDYGTGLADSIQNPDYSPFNLDRWGNPQPRGDERHDSLMSHVNQNIDMSTFDPAAWQLKRITLPSGGEILIQYEQNDYLYVQDRRALAMVSLKPYSDLLTSLNQQIDNKYYLNVEKDLGITSPTEKAALAQLIRDEFKNQKIFFKYFYALIGTSADLHSCYSDYVKGYVDLDSCNVDSDGLYIKLGDGQPFDGDAYELPRNVCIDYVKKEKSGKLRPIGNCNASDGGIQDNITSPLAIAQQLISKIGTTFNPGATCLNLNEKLSYLRIPVLHGKKGGGIRVKRILMHDTGIESGDEMLYGSEYIYKTTDGESSGVATNEPTEGKEENALVTFLPKRNDQSIPNRLIAGKDKEQFEGPVGEYLLPAPSVGYSRVVVKNIHSGKTNTGFMVSEFYTAFDFPFDKYYNNEEITGSAVDHTGIAQKKDWLMIPAGFANISINNLWLSQGYRFVINEMHGQPQTVATFSGDYNDLGEPDSLMMSSMQEFTYYEPGEKIPLMTDVSTIVMGDPGKETEVVMERKSVEDKCMDTNFEMDVTVGLVTPVFPVYFSFMGSGSYSESKLRTHVTTKIIRYPAIQKSVKTYQDGIYHLTENIAFSPYTGKPLLTKTTDGYHDLDMEQSTNHNGTYLSYSIPAAKEYKEMGQKAANEQAKITVPSPGVTCTLSVASGVYTMAFAATTGHTVCNTMSTLNRGDLIQINGSNAGFYHVDETIGSSVTVLPSRLLNGASTPATGAVSSFEIIRSGRTNQLNTVAGTFTTYGTGQDISIDTLNPTYLTSREGMVADLNAYSGTALHITGISRNILIGGSCLSSEDGYYLGLSESSDILYMRIYSDARLDNELCTSAIGPYPGTFSLDRKTGNIVYYSNDNPCHSLPVPCLNFCKGTGQSINPVVAASASTFNQHWPYDTTIYKFSSQPFSIYNDYETGAKGKWRMESSYAYNSPVVSGSRQGTTERNYKDAGTFPMLLFNWKNTSYNDSTQWVRTTTVTRYSPNGEAIEEQDAIGIKSAAKYGYKGMLPYLTAQNSDYRSVQFESFENLYASTKLEEGVSITSGQRDATKAHAGKASLKLLNTSTSTPGTPSAANLVLKPFKLSSQISSKGLELKVWVKDPGYMGIPVKAVLSDSANSSITQNVTFRKVAQTGEWTLYSSHITSFTSGLSTIVTTISTAYPYSGSSASPIWIDDVRLQPYDSQLMAYVYDTNTLRLVASFDDQHFGMFYQYNAEGKLVRKKIETEKGLKTIQETQYHTPLQARQ